MFLSPFVLFERLAAGTAILSFHRVLWFVLCALTFFFLFLYPALFCSCPLFCFVPIPCSVSFLSLVSLVSIRLLLFPCGLILSLCLQLAVFIQGIIDAKCSLSSICSRFKTLHFVPCLFSFTFPSKRTRNQYKTKTRTPYCLSPTHGVA